MFFDLWVSGPWDLDGWIGLEISVQMTSILMENDQNWSDLSRPDQT